MEQLDAPSLRLLSRTCSPLRRAGAPFDTGLSRDEAVEVLMAVCKDMPGHWACEECTALHPVFFRDTPRNSSHSPRSHYCQWGVESLSMLWPAHRHVQLALKLSRLASSSRNTPEQAKYLRDLLASTIWLSGRPNHHMPGVFVFRKSEVHRKIIRGRYLMKQVCRFEEMRGEVCSVSSVDGQFIAACQHQQIRYPYRRPTRHCARLPMLFPPRHDETLELALDAALRHPRVLIAESCPYCPTDFAVRQTPNTIDFWVWRDLGAEGSTTDLSWRIFADEPDDGPSDDNTIYHAPGSVYQAFERL